MVSDISELRAVGCPNTSTVSCFSSFSLVHGESSCAGGETKGKETKQDFKISWTPIFISGSQLDCVWLFLSPGLISGGSQTINV